MHYYICIHGMGCRVPTHIGGYGVHGMHTLWYSPHTLQGSCASLMGTWVLVPCT